MLSSLNKPPDGSLIALLPPTLANLHLRTMGEATPTQHTAD
jgi:hypothetical protein